ncbi:MULTISPECIES: NAD(P)/FAD-dependent oxidoreductase [Agathobacter]|uniref:Thioredoxin reductase n=1 Tax=Agathobacter ruminis TaxID=1712665 RepID=A0A2G3E2U2_9FIRM|nr:MULTISPECIES: NAD(P)/FAD-dependent oxidoreductase [Agathobacter]MBQ1681777.1 NAD(P)/FAD-dependent oxidoreductase [Agathobacter sp.]MDC7302295.1 NAD(P)/FAD-dependent oxidoreductase [Agathobacter ruminis]PHU37574.1 thioredoxin reductase [Agathobacter ruminis]
MVYDCVIVGSGPAGLEAALNLKIHNKNFLWLGSKNLSDKIRKAERISNYPGFANISGEKLIDAFLQQMKEMEIEVTEKMVNQIMPMGQTYALMAGSDYYETKSVILTTGVANKMTLPGESELLGKGVSYCATCDGGLYRGKKIAVLCNSKRFEHEITFLSELAEHVYLFKEYVEPAAVADNVEIMNTRLTAVEGADHVEAVIGKDESRTEVDGVFFLRDSIALSNLLPNLESENGHIKVNRMMETNLPGVFAAGDCTGRPYQYTKAMGEGNVASHSVIEYLSKLA